jgi:hypothetical protein
MTRGIFGHFFTVQTLIRAAFVALSLSSMGIAHSQTSSSYRAPAQNYWQNNWMSDGGG